MKTISKLSIAFVGIFIVLLVPFVVNVLFATEAPLPVFVARWEAGDLLSYLAAFGGAAAALYGVVLSVRYSRESQAALLRNQVAPCINLSWLQVSGRRSHFFEDMEVFAQVDGQEPGMRADTPLVGDKKGCGVLPCCEDDALHVMYIVIADSIISQRSLASDQRDLIEHSDAIEVIGGTTLFCENPVRYQPMRLKNVGLAPAINMRYTVLGPGSEGTDRDLGVPPITLGERDCAYIGLYLDTRCPISGEYTLSLHYYDVLGNQYRQHFPFEISCGEEASPEVPLLTMEYLISKELLHDDVIR